MRFNFNVLIRNCYARPARPLSSTGIVILQSFLVTRARHSLGVVRYSYIRLLS